MVVSVGESLVKFIEGEQVRVLRGEIAAEAEGWVTVKRRDATYRIRTAAIILIEEPAEDGGP